MSALAVIFSTAMVAETARMAVPYACAALGGVIGERSGVVNIALEGILLTSALSAVAVSLATGSALLGVLGGIGAGAAFGALHALLVTRGKVDAIVSGLALNLAAAGGTRFALRALYGSSSNSPSIAGFPRGAINPFFVVTVIAIAGAAWMLQSTRFGLRLRASGEDPAAAEALGVRVPAVRMAAVTLGGAAAGLGGAALAFDLHQFQAGMSGGRGFIALAAVIVGGWRPVRAGAACLVFASLDALEIVLQGQTRLPAQALGMLPYLATLVALILVSKRRR